MRIFLRYQIIYSLILILKVLSSQGEINIRERRSENCRVGGCKAPTIKSPPKNFTIELGSKKIIRCRAQGVPPPIITWEKDDVKIEKIDQWSTKYRISSNNVMKSGKVKTVRSNLEINNLYNKEAGYYTCTARNEIGSIQSSRSYIKFTSGKTVFNPKNIPGSSSFVDPMKRDQCVAYRNGSVCLPYLDSTQTIYSPDGPAHVQIQEDTLKELASSLHGHLSSTCLPFALQFLCYYNFGYCDSRSNKPKKLRLCKKDCINISKVKCFDEFTTAKKHEALEQLIPSSCDDFPTTNCLSMQEEYRKVQNMFSNTDGKQTIKDLSKSTNYNIKPPTVGQIYANPGENCFLDKGENYRGTQNRTHRSPCRSWRGTTEGIKYGALINTHNYCRNLAGSRDRPWCYVMRNGKSIMEYCDLPTCAILVRTATTNILYTIIPCLIFALVVSLAIITLAWRRHKQHYYDSAPTTSKELVPRVNPKIEELHREDLCDFRLLGDGSIGRIYTADYTGSRDGRTFTACVAVKAIIEKATQKQIKDFVREAETRANFKHENILALIGVISKEEPLSLIYEYFEYGDLHEYLLKHSPNFSDAHADGDCEPLEYADLLVIATQIASGMSYLSTHAFVHKDLAARSCLVGDSGIIKITDISGLSDMYASDYYRAPGCQPLPVRWMSPESISHSSFSTASDVWSYGVLLWEVFSYGSRPYFGLSNFQAMERICDFECLVLPEGCPIAIFNIMERCWMNDANSRPTFVEVYNQLKCLSDHSINSNIQVNHDVSLHSLRSSLSNSHREGPHGGDMYNRGSLSSSSHMHSHSSNHSISSSQHPASIHSHDVSIPPSLASMSISIPPSIMNDHRMTPPVRNGHHSLPKDMRHVNNDRLAMSRDGMSREGHHSLPRDTRYHVTKYDSRPPSNNHHPVQPPLHSNGYHGASSYVSSLPSYPPSLNCPPVSTVFSRQSSSRASSRKASAISYGRDEGPLLHNGRGDGYASANSHTFL